MYRLHNVKGIRLWPSRLDMAMRMSLQQHVVTTIKSFTHRLFWHRVPINLFPDGDNFKRQQVCIIIVRLPFDKHVYCNTTLKIFICQSFNLYQ